MPPERHVRGTHHAKGEVRVFPKKKDMTINVKHAFATPAARKDFHDEAALLSRSKANITS